MAVLPYVKGKNVRKNIVKCAFTVKYVVATIKT